MEMQIKTTVRYHLMPFRMVILKKMRHEFWWGFGKLKIKKKKTEHMYTAGENVTWYTGNYRKQYESSSRN